jgi:molybdopterin molybdotransferase
MRLYEDARRVMIEIDRALGIVRSVPVSGRVESIPLQDALGRVLAREVRSPIDSPPFDKSAMDGFAVGKDDDSVILRVVDTVAAGASPSRAIRKGECARIMTGAMLPTGTGRVIRHEYVQEEDGRIRPLTSETGDNVIPRGASLRAGEPVLRPGVLGPHDVGALAASGIERIDVAVPPRTAILCTGPEVRPAGTALGPGQIYDSNGPQLCAQLAAMHCPGRMQALGVEDEPGPLTAAIREALSGCDVLLLAGGVSAGRFDYVPGCLEELGAEILFHGVAIKPGKPTLFARLGGQYIFGLPGNPVSTFVIFEVFVKPFLYRRMGIDWAPVSYAGTLAHTITKTQDERTEFLPVRVRQGRVEAVAYHGSAHLNALAGADGLVRIDVGVRELSEGTQVDVRPL